MEQQDVLLYVFDTLSDWEAGYAVAGINNSQFQKTQGRYRVQTVAVQKNAVTTMGGIKIIPDLSLAELEISGSTMLILPGGISWDEGENNEIIGIARDFLENNKPVAGICGATAGLARAGLLDKRRHTSNALEYLAITGYKGADLYENEPVVTDNNLITSSGTAALDFAYHIFKVLDLYSPAVLEAWYGLYKTGKPEYFSQLMKATANA